MSEASALLPWWAPVGPFIALAAAIAIGVPLALVAAWWSGRPYRALPADAHWTERARLGFVVRRSAMLAVLVFVGLPFVLVAALRVGPLSLGGERAFVASALGGFVVAGVVVYARATRTLGTPPLTARRIVAWSGVLAATRPAWIVAAFWAVLVPHDVSGFALAAWMLGAAVSWLALAYATVPALRVAGLLRAPGPRLVRIVAVASEALAVPPPRVRSLRMPSPNAMALPIGRAIWVTEEALALLEEDELVAIVKHELGHLSESRGVVAVRVLASLLPLGLGFAPWAFARGGPAGGAGLLAAFVALVAAFQWLSRRLEHAADTHAHDDAGSEAYARAMETMHRATGLPAVLSGSQTHPNLYDRLVRAGAPPAYPRPEPPPNAHRWSFAVLAAATLATLPQIFGPLVAVELSTTAARFDAALTAGEPRSVRQVASRLSREGAGPDAWGPWIVAAARLDPEHHQAVAVDWLWWAGRCDAALALYGTAPVPPISGDPEPDASCAEHEW